MNTLICQAIRERKVLRFNYEGGSRDVEPFCYGRGTSGNELLRGYQISGVSSSGQPIGWKLFKVNEITSLTITNTTFSGNRNGYVKNDSAMIEWYCQV